MLSITLLRDAGRFSLDDKIFRPVCTVPYASHYITPRCQVILSGLQDIPTSTTIISYFRQGISSMYVIRPRNQLTLPARVGPEKSVHSSPYVHRVHTANPTQRLVLRHPKGPHIVIAASPETLERRNITYAQRPAAPLW